MKKNRSLEKLDVSKQYKRLIIRNIFSFLLIFILLGFFASFLINNLFFNSIKNKILISSEDILYTIKEEDGPKGTNIIFQKDKNARIMIIFYNEDESIIASSDSLYSYTVKNYDSYMGILFDPYQQFSPLYQEYLQATEEAMKLPIYEIDSSRLNKYNEYETVETNSDKYQFITYSFAINTNSAPNVKYAKILVMVNGEISSRDNILTIYICCASVMMLLGVIASILLSAQAIKPIEDSLEKQLSFVGDASHELRTPLSIIQSKLENILTKKDETVYDVSEDIAVSLREINRLSKLTSDLLTLTKSDNNRTLLSLEIENIEEIVIETSNIFKDLAVIQEKNFILETTEVKAKIDKNKITQLLIILLDNAFRYTSTDDTIKVTLSKTNTDFILSIEDTGIGISEETKKHMFERFYRADKARSRETGGNGLGLAIAQTIVFEHQGKITVEHNQPKGTKFNVIISKKH